MVNRGTSAFELKPVSAQQQKISGRIGRPIHLPADPSWEEQMETFREKKGKTHDELMESSVAYRGMQNMADLEKSSNRKGKRKNKNLIPNYWRKGTRKHGKSDRESETNSGRKKK